MIYLKCDVLLLADVFENFRKTCIAYYDGLDPANYISAPSLAWDALLKKTEVELDLISDEKILDIIERQKKGGLCFVGSKRHVKANNKYLPDFDVSKPSNYIMYWDANNLYGWAMSQKLPFKDLKFDTEVTIEEILKTGDESDIGYIIECDLEYPIELHNLHNDYPLAVENTSFNDSPYMKEYALKNNINTKNKCNKLIPNLYDKKKYVLHYRNLQLYVSLGLKVKKIHRVL